MSQSRDARHFDSAVPLLSIVTVTFNAGEVLRETLQSVRNQDFKDLEVIIIDGGSIDRTLEIANEFSDIVKYLVSEPDQGLYDAMNKGMAAARGLYLQFLNAGDNLCEPDVLSRIFSDHGSEKCDVIYGDIISVNVDGRETYLPARSFTMEELLARGTGVLCHQSIFVKRSIAPRYTLELKYKAELNWYFDLVEIEGLSVRHVGIPVVHYADGGFGYQNFLSNRLEWVLLVWRRFGFRTLLDSRLVPFLIKNSQYRYPWMKHIVKALRI